MGEVHRLRQVPAALPSGGVDPGAEGSAGLLDVDGRTVLAASHWVERRRGWRYLAQRPDGDLAELDLPTLHDVGVALNVEWQEALRRAGRAFEWTLAVEGFFVAAPDPRKGKRGAPPMDVVKLAESGAQVWGPLLGCTVGEPFRPTWRTWAAQLFSAATNEQLARVQRPWCDQVLIGLHPELAEVEHTRDALAIARLGWVVASRRAA